VSVRLLAWIQASSRCGSCAGCRGFSPRQLRPDWQVQHGAVRCCTASLAADPLHPSAGGASPTESRPLALFVAVWARRRALSARASTSFARLAPGPEATHLARTARVRACLRHEQRGDPRRLPSARGHGLATAVEDLTQTGSPACCLPAPFHVLRWDPPPSAVVDLRPTLPRPGERLAAPDLETGKMLLTDFCNRRATRAPDGSLDSRGGCLACAELATSDGAKAPADDPGHDAFDDAP